MNKFENVPTSPHTCSNVDAKASRLHQKFLLFRTLTMHDHTCIMTSFDVEEDARVLRKMSRKKNPILDDNYSYFHPKHGISIK